MDNEAKRLNQEYQLATNSTWMSDETPFGFQPDLRATLGATLVSTICILSQIPVILMGAGLEGDFSAKVLMCVQAASDIAKRVMSIYFAAGASIGAVLWLQSSIACKITQYVVFIVTLMPDWLMILVATDRVLAVEFPIWYRDNCTIRAAWIPIAAVTLILGILGIPRIIYARLTPEIPLCQANNWFYIEIITILGVPALVIVAVMTARLLYAVNTQRKRTHNFLC